MQVNPALTNEFATAAFRMGHSLIRDKLSRYDVAQQILKKRDFVFDNITFKSDFAYEYVFKSFFKIIAIIIIFI